MNESKKDRFEELYALEVLSNRNNSYLHEMRDIYHAIQKENETLIIKLKAEETANNRVLEIAQRKLKQSELKFEDLLIRKQNNIEDLQNEIMNLEKENKKLKEEIDGFADSIGNIKKTEQFHEEDKYW